MKYRLTKSKNFLDDKSGDIDDKDFAVNKKSKCDSDATQKSAQKGKVIIDSNNICK